MASYTLIGSSSIVQVLSPKVVSDMVAATIETHPTSIRATKLVTQADFDSGSAAADLAAFADAIEAVVAGGKVVGGSGNSNLDASGLQQYFVAFEVGYNPPGAPTGTVTVDVDVPVSLLTPQGTDPNSSPPGAVLSLIDAAYNNLVALSGNTPATVAAATPAAAAAPPSSAQV